MSLQCDALNKTGWRKPSSDSDDLLCPLQEKEELSGFVIGFVFYSLENKHFSFHYAWDRERQGKLGFSEHLEFVLPGYFVRC